MRGNFKLLDVELTIDLSSLEAAPLFQTSIIIQLRAMKVL